MMPPAAYRTGMEAIDHLDPVRWAFANRQLLSKALAEFSHEGLLQPDVLSQDTRRRCEAEVTTADGSTRYRFHARRYALDHWQIDETTLQKTVHGRDCPPTALDFLLEFRDALGLGQEVLPVYLEEINSTLAAACYQLAHPGPNAAALANADFQVIEAAMREGHPAFVANHGRVGWGLDDYQLYAPEAARPLQLLWLAVHRRHAGMDTVEGLEPEALLAEELGHLQLRAFRQRLRDQRRNPADYLLMPVHPWQWQYKIGTAFATDIAGGDIVLLGPGEDHYQAQQSIRTWFNHSRPGRAYVKTALSILNMGFMRGLSAEYMRSTPAINQWLYDLVHRDQTLLDTGFDILREIAAIGYRQPHYQCATDGGSPYRKMLAALWRESPVARSQPGHRLMTMAALLHIDIHGQSLLAATVRASGLAPRTWLARYLHAYLRPLLHCFFAYGLVFMPHGENVILRLDRHAVCGAWLKDIGEEIAVMRPDLELPESVRRIAVDVPLALQPLSIFTDIFDGFFRFMAPIMDIHLGFAEPAYWNEVAACIRDYQRDHPEFTDRFSACDLFAPRFARSCLNRLQLKNNRQMVDLADPAGSLQLVGQLRNPVAGQHPPPLPLGVVTHG